MAVLRVPHPFTRYIFCDENAKAIEALSRRADRIEQETGRNLEFDHSADVNQLKSLGPSRDDSIERKASRLSTIVGTVEHLAAIQPTLVVDGNGVGRLRPATIGLPQNAVLQT